MTNWIPKVGEKVLLECIVVKVARSRFEGIPFITVDPCLAHPLDYGKLVMLGPEGLHPMKEDNDG